MMTAQEYRDQYAKEQGFDDWADLVRSTAYLNTLFQHTDEVMKRYALVSVPMKFDLDGPNTMPYSMLVGWNDCIEQIKKNIG